MSIPECSNGSRIVRVQRTPRIFSRRITWDKQYILILLGPWSCLLSFPYELGTARAWTRILRPSPAPPRLQPADWAWLNGMYTRTMISQVSERQSLVLKVKTKKWVGPFESTPRPALYLSDRGLKLCKSCSSWAEVKVTKKAGPGPPSKGRRSFLQTIHQRHKKRSPKRPTKSSNRIHAFSLSICKHMNITYSKSTQSSWSNMGMIIHSGFLVYFIQDYWIITLKDPTTSLWMYPAGFRYNLRT